MVTVRRFLVLFIFGLTYYSSGLYAAMNLSRLNEYALKPSFHIGRCLQTSMLIEGGISDRTYNEDGNCVDVLQMLNRNQNALAMLKGYPACSPLSELLEEINAIDDGIRGHLEPSGELKLNYSFAWAARYFFNDNLSIAAYLPFYSVQLQNVMWCDLTKNLTPSDRRVKELLTGNIYEIVREFGCGLDIGCWRRVGIGDLALLVEWIQDFKQDKPFLKNVRIGCRAGLNLPTGLKKDEDKICALPFGNDGAVGVVLAGGLGVTLGCYIQAGFDVELVHLFGNERVRRVRVYPDQTNLLYLKKAVTYKDWGLTQRFNLYLDVKNVYKGFSGRVDYQYMKHGTDELSITANDFSTTVANTGSNLDDWTCHTVVAKIGYDFGCHLKECTRTIPQLWIYGKVPVAGSRSTMFSSVGVIVSLEF